jgi:hypothetical protein
MQGKTGYDLMATVILDTVLSEHEKIEASKAKRLVYVSLALSHINHYGPDVGLKVGSKIYPNIFEFIDSYKTEMPGIRDELAKVNDTILEKLGPRPSLTTDDSADFYGPYPSDMPMPMQKTEAYAPNTAQNYGMPPPAYSRPKPRPPYHGMLPPRPPMPGPRPYPGIMHPASFYTKPMAPNYGMYHQPPRPPMPGPRAFPGLVPAHSYGYPPPTMLYSSIPEHEPPLWSNMSGYSQERTAWTLQPYKETHKPTLDSGYYEAGEAEPAEAICEETNPSQATPVFDSSYAEKKVKGKRVSYTGVKRSRSDMEKSDTVESTAV